MTYFFLILALSLDTFTLALSYEADKIQIPLSSNLIISFICSFVLMLSLFLGGFIQNIISPHILKVIAFIILFSIGLFKIFDNRIKNFIKKQNITRVGERGTFEKIEILKINKVQKLRS